MALPEEDRGPVWLRDWQYIEADIQAMDDFAQKLRAEVETNYAAHLTPICDDMTTPLPTVDARFTELVTLLTTHQQATDTTTHQVRDYANRSAGIAHAASEISTNYGNADAFAQATLNAVNKALGSTGVAAPGAAQPGTAPDSGNDAGATIPISEGY